MKALIFAAGRGERMRPLSDTTAKPLLVAGGKRLIEYQIAALARAGIRALVINTAHLAQQIEASLGDGSRYGVQLRYSREGERAEDALETLGGVVHALPLLDLAPNEAFIAVSGDIVTDFDYASLQPRATDITRGELDAHLVLVDNPPFHPRGDMGLVDERITLDQPWFTYANIALLTPRIFAGETVAKKSLFPWLYQFAQQGRVSGERFQGRWYNIGTPEQLSELDSVLRKQQLSPTP